MKSLLVFIGIYLCGFCLGQAQEFRVNFKNKQITKPAGTYLNTEIVVLATGGFSASVFLQVNSLTLTIDEKALSTTIINSPYLQPVKLSFKSSLSDTGVHKIIVTGKNQNLLVHDTLTLTLVKSDQWRTFNIYYGTQNFAIASDSLVYFTTLYSSNFLGKVSNNSISYQQGWDFMPSLNREGTKAPMFIDKNSHVWTGSSAGIGKYDGSFWTAYPFSPGLGLQRMCMDSNELLWYYIDNRSAPYHFSNLNFMKNGISYLGDTAIRRMPFLKEGFGLNGLNVDKSGNIWTIAAPNPNTFMRTNVLLKNQNNTWKSVRFPYDSSGDYSIYTALNEIAVDNNGNLWTWYTINKGSTISKSGLLKYNGSTWEEFESEIKATPKNIAIDNNGTIWMQFYGALVSFDMLEWNIYSSQNSPIPQAYPSSITIDKHNNIWMTWEGSNVIFNPENITGMQMALQTLTTDIYDEFSPIIDKSIGSQASPNPSQNSTTIHYSLKTESPVSMSIYNSLGIEVFKNNFGFKNAGDNSETISTSELPSGQYYYVLKAGAQQSTQPLVIVR